MIYGSRDSTKDVDALVHPSNLARKLIIQVAREQDLPDDWINDEVRVFLADREAKRKLKGGEFGPGLQVFEIGHQFGRHRLRFVHHLRLVRVELAFHCCLI